MGRWSKFFIVPGRGRMQLCRPLWIIQLVNCLGTLTVERAIEPRVLLFMIKRRGACQGLEWAEHCARDGRQIELQFSAPQSLLHATKRRYSRVTSLMNVCSSS